MENQTQGYTAVEKWLYNLKWKPCVTGVIIGCVCTSVLGLSIGLIAHPYLMSFSSHSGAYCSNEIHWEPCSSRSGNGTQIGIKQIRQTADGSCAITSTTTVQRSCNSQHSCRVDGGWSDWKQYGSCSVTCGKGVIPIVRRCDSPTPMHDGKYCVGESYDLGTCMMEACPGKNLALKKQTRQSSTEGFKYYSMYAVDGKQCQGDYRKCAHTQLNYQAWWAADLGDVFDIQKVVLYGRTDCCTDRLSNFDIDVFKPLLYKKTTLYNFDQGNVKRCHHHRGEVPNHVLNASCPHGTTGQFIRIRLRGSNHLSLCEVEVYGSDIVQNLIIENNFMFHEPYMGKNVNTIRGLTRENCTELCMSTDANQDCFMSYISKRNICVVVGKYPKP